MIFKTALRCGKSRKHDVHGVILRSQQNGRSSIAIQVEEVSILLALNPIKATIRLHWMQTRQVKIHYYSFKIILSLKTWLKHAYLHRSIDVKLIFDSPRLGLSSSSNSRCRPSSCLSCLLAVLAMFLAIFCLVLTLKTSEMSAIFSSSQAKQLNLVPFSVNGALTCENAAFLTSFPR